MIDRVRAGEENTGDYNEAFKYAGNNFAADPSVLTLLLALHANAEGRLSKPGLDYLASLWALFQNGFTPLSMSNTTPRKRSRGAKKPE